MHRFHFRIRIVSLLVVFIVLVFIARLFWLQVLHGEKYQETVNDQFISPVGTLFDRGSIYFSRKDGTILSAATVMSGFKLAINTKEISNPEAVYLKLVNVIPLSRETFFQKAARVNDPYEEVANHLTKEQADTVRALDIPGVSLIKEKWRFYPGGHMASRTLGLLGYKGDVFAGRYGLERSYDAVLSRGETMLYSNFFADIFSSLRSSVFENKQKEGDIVTTIEPEVQSRLESALGDILRDTGPEQAGGVVMNPKTGEIIAMAVLPDFDPNNFSEVKDVSLFGNPLVEHVFELGSVVKTLTMTSGIDAGVVTPNTTYFDPGYFTFNTEKIHNYDKKGRGQVSMQEVINQSLNTGVAHVMQKLGQQTFRNYFYKFEVDKKTNIDLPGEVNNLVSNLKSTRDIEYATASFGQGIALTPISALHSFSAIANDGHLATPHVVKKIIYTDGSEKVLEYPVSEPIVKKESTDTMTRMMVTAVDTAYMSGKIKLPHYSVAAKTGTAQIALPSGKGYYSDRYLHSMYGFYPAYDPEFITLFYIINPRSDTYSITTLGPEFMHLAQFLVDYYEVAPDR